MKSHTKPIIQDCYAKKNSSKIVQRSAKLNFTLTMYIHLKQGCYAKKFQRKIKVRHQNKCHNSPEIFHLFRYQSLHFMNEFIYARSNLNKS